MKLCNFEIIIKSFFKTRVMLISVMIIGTVKEKTFSVHKSSKFI